MINKQSFLTYCAHNNIFFANMFIPDFEDIDIILLKIEIEEEDLLKAASLMVRSSDRKESNEEDGTGVWGRFRVFQEYLILVSPTSITSIGCSLRSPLIFLPLTEVFFSIPPLSEMKKPF